MDLAGKSFLVTGASAGIGRATMSALVARGGSVIAATRSEEKTRPLLDELRRQHAGADVLWLPIDLGDLRSVKRAAEVFIQSGRPLYALINNAAVAGMSGYTRDGFEIAVGTNHLGHFLLTDLLLPKLQEGPRARIVNVASRAHVRVRGINWERMARSARGPRGRIARYQLSKLFNVVHAAELARRLQGTNVTTCSMHPGVIASDLWREIPRPIQSVMKMFMGTNAEGAQQVVYCATAPELEKTSGRYYELMAEYPMSPLAADPKLGEELFARSERAISQALETSETHSLPIAETVSARARP